MKYASTTLVFVVSALLALGLVMLYSAMMFHSGASFWGGAVVVVFNRASGLCSYGKVRLSVA